MKPIQIGLLGLGTVGKGTYDVSLISSPGTMLIEFSESFGEISLLRMYLGGLGVTSEEIYDSATQIGTFYPTHWIGIQSYEKRR